MKGTEQGGRITKKRFRWKHFLELECPSQSPELNANKKNLWHSFESHA